MKRIEFPYFNNVFLDNGTIGLYNSLKEDADLENGTHFGLEENKLWIQHNELFGVLEQVYYAMGRKVYDTYTHKQEQEGGNIYFTLDRVGKIDGVHQFPKMNTYGFTELLTNNAQGTTTHDANSRKFALIEKEEPSLAAQIQEVFEQRKVKLLKKIYFNEPYTKLTRLEQPTQAYFEEGKHICYLTGQKRKKLVDSQATSPFLSGLTNFNSLLSNSDKKISWEAMYLSRFAAATCLYQYPNKLREALNVYFIYSNNLTNLEYVRRHRFKGLVKDEDSLKLNEYVANFPLNENDKTHLGKSNDFVGINESLFYLVYSLYKGFLQSGKLIDRTNLRHAMREKPIGLVAMRAESFASTMRPKHFEYLTHFSFMIELVYELEKEGVNWRYFVQSLKILKPSLNSPKNKKRYEMERQFRNEVLGKILKAKSILKEMEGFFNDCYGYLLDTLNDPQKSIGFKRYNDLTEFIKKYESLINPKIMEDKELQEKAIKMGAQIGQGILSYGETPDRKVNARQGRKYIIALRKANQFDRFLHELGRIQGRFTLTLSRDFLNNIDEERFNWARQFIIISALNQINAELSPKQKPEANQA